MTNKMHNAIELLKADHRDAEDLFKKYEEAKKDNADNEKRYDIARQVCAALLVHMELEEMLFYPAAKEVIQEDQLIDEAIVEHKGAKDLINELGNTSLDSSMFDAKVTVLSEQIQHHVDEEENKLFPLVSKSELDLDALGMKLAEQKERSYREHNMPVTSK